MMRGLLSYLCPKRKCRHQWQIEFVDVIRDADCPQCGAKGLSPVDIDMIEEAGGATSISGVAKCNAFLASMKKNRSRVEQLVMEPARKAIEEASK